MKKAVAFSVAAVGIVAVGVALAASGAYSGGGGSFTVTGRSGTVYTVKHVKAFTLPDGRKQSFWDLFVGDSRILRYAQLDNDTNSRILIVSPLSSSDPRVDIAMRDFGVRFEGGPVAELASATAPVRLQSGQIVVSPGAWMATADVGFPKSLVVSAALIRDALKQQGWTQIMVATKPPAGWPISTKGNYFVEAVWEGQPRIFQLPSEVIDIRSRALA